jgi:hypothetical protein
MLTTKQPLQPGAPAAAVKPGLDPRVLGLASVASVLGGVVASAFGGGPLATVVCAAISPWITAFLTHPGPHRVRRIVAVALFALLVSTCRKAVAAVRTAARLPDGKPRSRRDEASGERAEGHIGTVSPGQARLAGGWLRQVTLTAGIAVVVAVVSVTTVEAIRGQAFAAERDTTFFGGGLSSAPTVLVPDAVTAAAGNHSATRVIYRVTAADTAGHPLVPVCDPPSGALFAIGDTRVGCSATDVAGEQASAHFVVTVRSGGNPRPPDRKQPVLAVPEDFTRDTTTAVGARVTYTASAHDARDGALTPDCQPTSGTVLALGRTRVTCTATDAAGNTAHAGFTINVIRAGGHDDTAPQITVPDPIETPATSSKGATVTYDVSVTDNRDGTLKPRCDPPSGSVFSRGTTTVSCSAQDSSDNKATETFTITVVRAGRADLTPPQITVPDPIKTPATSKHGATVTYRVSATDNRDRALKPSCDPRSGSIFKVGKTAVICSAHDSAGNEDTKSFTVTVVPAPTNQGSDRTPPAITVPDPIKTSGTSRDGATVTYDVSAKDNRDRALRPNCAPRSGTAFEYGTTTVNCAARDSAGNLAAKSFTVAVIDDTPPVITVPDTIVESPTTSSGTSSNPTSSSSATITYDVSATDIRDGTVTPNCEPRSGSTFDYGTTTVKCSAQDSAGNKATKSFAVIVRYQGGT